VKWSSRREEEAPAAGSGGCLHDVAVTEDDEGGRFLLAAARPLHEPIARYGPFVMNTRAEIEQTLEELRSGRFLRKEPRDA